MKEEILVIFFLTFYLPLALVDPLDIVKKKKIFLCEIGLEQSQTWAVPPLHSAWLGMNSLRTAEMAMTEWKRGSVFEGVCVRERVRHTSQSGSSYLLSLS